MGKILSCTDCGRKFRGERRRPCSNNILLMLRQKHSDSTALSGDFLHETCFMKLYKIFSGPVEQQRHVRTKNILFNIHPLWVHCLSHQKYFCSFLALIFFLSLEYSAPTGKKTSPQHNRHAGGNTEILGGRGQAHAEQASPSCAGRMRDVESSSFGFGGTFPSHPRAGPCRDLRRAPTAVPAQDCTPSRRAHCFGTSDPQHAFTRCGREGSSCSRGPP